MASLSKAPPSKRVSTVTPPSVRATQPPPYEHKHSIVHDLITNQCTDRLHAAIERVYHSLNIHHEVSTKKGAAATPSSSQPTTEQHLKWGILGMLHMDSYVLEHEGQLAVESEVEVSGVYGDMSSKRIDLVINTPRETVLIELKHVPIDFVVKPTTILEFKSQSWSIENRFHYLHACKCLVTLPEMMVQQAFNNNGPLASATLSSSSSSSLSSSSPAKAAIKKPTIVAVKHVLDRAVAQLACYYDEMIQSHHPYLLHPSDRALIGKSDSIRTPLAPLPMTTTTTTTSTKTTKDDDTSSLTETLSTLSLSDEGTGPPKRLFRVRSILLVSVVTVGFVSVSHVNARLYKRVDASV